VEHPSRGTGASGCATLQSLTGHQSPVECVTFDAAEENVVAGSASGTIKLWDLEEAKGALRTNEPRPAVHSG